MNESYPTTPASAPTLAPASIAPVVTSATAIPSNESAAFASNTNMLLSGNHLKTVASFGCPSLDKISVFAGKRLRKMLSIKEDNVCSQCMLKDSCKYANQGVEGIATKNLLIVDVIKVIVLYNLEQVLPELTVPDEVRDSANKLFEKYIELSQASKNVSTATEKKKHIQEQSQVNITNEGLNFVLTTIKNYHLHTEQNSTGGRVFPE